VSAVCQPMSGRLATYRVVVADDLTLGLSQAGCFGSAVDRAHSRQRASAACMCRFDDRPAAVAWLQEREWAPAEAGDPPCSPPGRRSAAA
jgi:hypothetical protein